MHVRCQLVVLLLAGWVVPSEAANNDWRQPQPARVTRGAPAKGPSEKTFSETLEDRKAAMGTPAGEQTAMQGEAARKIKAIELATSREREDQACVSRLMNHLAMDTNRVNRTNEDGRTLLHQAAFAGFPKSTKFLLGKGSDRNARDLSGATPRDLALRAGYPDVAAVIDQFNP